MFVVLWQHKLYLIFVFLSSSLSRKFSIVAALCRLLSGKIKKKFWRLLRPRSQTGWRKFWNCTQEFSISRVWFFDLLFVVFSWGHERRKEISWTACTMDNENGKLFIFEEVFFCSSLLIMLAIRKASREIQKKSIFRERERNCYYFERTIFHYFIHVVNEIEAWVTRRF